MDHDEQAKTVWELFLDTINTVSFRDAGPALKRGLSAGFKASYDEGYQARASEQMAEDFEDGE